MDRKYIDDHHVVARYLAEQLSEADRAAFEAYRAEHPEIVRELEAAARFKVGLAQLSEAGELKAVLEGSQGSRRSPVMRYAGVVAGLAAAGIVVLAGFNLLQVPVIGVTPASVSGRFRAELPATGPYELIRFRSEARFDAQLTLPAQPAAITLRVLPETENADRYRVELRSIADSQAKTVASADGLAPGADHFVVIYLNSSQLAPGTYELVVAPQNAASRQEESVFRIGVAPRPKQDAP